MTKPRPPISARKTPRQARSTQLVDDILEAAIRVLMREGAPRFTTVRVAKEAGVSVGSLYQYFPNKEALLFRLQADEWRETSELLESILGDEREPPFERFRRAVLIFFRTEHEEARLRVALDDAGALLRDAPETAALTRRMRAMRRAFIDRALPGVPAADRAFAAEFVFATMASLAEGVTGEDRTRAQVDAFARACGATLVAFLEAVERGERPWRARP